MKEDEKDDLTPDTGFDLGTYISDYKGRTRTERLLFIADKAPSLAPEAIRLALAETKKTAERDQIIDKKHYTTIYEAAGKVLADAPQPDQEFLEKLEKVTKERKLKLDDEIGKWRNLSQRDNTHRAYMTAAAYLCRLGLFDQALQKLTDARDFCSNAQDANEVHMAIMKASIRQGSMASVLAESDRLLLVAQTNSGQDTVSEAILCQTRAMAGLYHLKNGNFNMVVHNLTGAVRIGNFGDVMSKRDVGVYATLCGMASLNRTRLKSEILNNAALMRCLDKEPRILKAAKAMAQSKYRELMETLKSAIPDLKLDYYLERQLNELMTAIRATALVQYFKPFSSMDLNRMANDFGFTVPEIEEELYQAILKGRIQAKMDIADHVLVEHTEKTNRQSVVQKIVKEGEGFCREAMQVVNNLQLSHFKLKISKRGMGGDNFDDENEGQLGGGGGGSKFGLLRWGNSRKGPRNRKRSGQ